MIGNLEKARLQNLWQRHLGKESVNRSLQIGQDVKMLLPHVNDLRTVTLAEEDFSHQVRRTGNLFPQPSLSLPNGFINKVALVAEMKVLHGLDKDFYSSSLT